MQQSFRPVPYKRIHFRKKRLINWHTVALIVMALIVIITILIVEFLALVKPVY